MDNHSAIVFVCEHGAAKSMIAAAHFNRIAEQLGLEQRAIARGTTPDPEISLQTVEGLSEDGLSPTESMPQKLTQADLDSAQHVISFCELPVEYRQKIKVEHWGDVPLVSADYKQARDVIIDHIRRLLAP